MKPLIILLISAFTAFGAASTNISFFKNIQADNLTVSTNAVVGTLNTGQGANELYDMDQNVLTTSSPSFGSLTVTTNMAVGGIPIAGRTMTIRRDNLTTLPVDGLFVTNATPATAGVTVQDSPSVTWSGGAWLTGSLSNAPIVFRSYVAPVGASATALNSKWTLDGSMNGGAFANPLTYTGSGILTSTLDIVSTSGDVQSTSAGSFRFGASRSAFASSANGAVEVNNSTASTRSTLQANIPQITKTANYTIVALDSGLQFNNIGASATNRLDLPTAVAKMRFMGYVDAAFRMQFQATGGDVIRDAASVSGANAGIYSGAVGSCIEFFSPKAGLWVVATKNGVWTIE